MHYLSCWCGTGTNSRKSALGYVTPNLRFASGGIRGHVVHCGVSGAQNVNAIFFFLGWDRYGFQKKRIETCSAKLVFLHQWDMRVT
jgi:hypothetical protein